MAPGFSITTVRQHTSLDFNIQVNFLFFTLSRTNQDFTLIGTWRDILREVNPHPKGLYLPFIYPDFLLKRFPIGIHPFCVKTGEPFGSYGGCTRTIKTGEGYLEIFYIRPGCKEGNLEYVVLVSLCNAFKMIKFWFLNPFQGDLILHPYGVQAVFRKEQKRSRMILEEGSFF